MRTAGLPSFRKLWGRIDQDLVPGRYYIKVKNNYDVDNFKGSKSVVLSTVNSFGGQNYFIAWCYMTVGALCIAVSMISTMLLFRNRRNGDKLIF